VTLLYFAWVRQKLGRSEEQIELPAGIATVADLIAHLRARGGGYEEVFGDPSRLRAAVDQEHAGFDAPIGIASEIAFFPPVTGG
jgi:molybdopterin synthase sulfur carrier subunit